MKDDHETEARRAQRAQTASKGPWRETHNESRKIQREKKIMRRRRSSYPQVSGYPVKKERGVPLRLAPRGGILIRGDPSQNQFG